MPYTRSARLKIIDFTALNKHNFFIVRGSLTFKSLCQLYAPSTATLQDFVVSTQSVFMDLVCVWNTHKPFPQRAGLFN